MKLTLAKRKLHLNWTPGRPDHRRAALKLSPAPSMISAVKPLCGFFPAWDQGEEGSCTAHGNGALITHRLHIEYPNRLAFMPSRQFLYYNERKLEGDVKQDGGAIVGDGMKALEKWGICPESVWPYSKRFSLKPSAAAYKLALQHLGLTAVTVAADVNSMKAAIAAGNPLSGGFTVFDSFMSNAVANTGVMPVPKQSEKQEGGHCVAFDGFNDNLVENGCTGYFFCRNSWGPSWGLKAEYQGWFLMPYKVVELGLCSDFHALLKMA